MEKAAEIQLVEERIKAWPLERLESQGGGLQEAEQGGIPVLYGS
jgi:hypothetical protein